MDTTIGESTPLPPDLQQKKKASFLSLPMKTLLLVLVTILAVGAFVFSQKNKNNVAHSYAANAQKKVAKTSVSPSPVMTADILGMEVSPTVKGEILLEIITPAQGEVVTSPNIIITGKTAPNADIMINDADKKADATGAFSVSILIDEGDNIITITSVDENGKYAEKELKVTLNTTG
ncbi:MAG: hypothetical protein ABIO02_00865 [Patescibacteria group bacterium]